MPTEADLFLCPRYPGHARLLPAACARMQEMAVLQAEGKLYGRHHETIAVNYSRCLECPTGASKRALVDVSVPLYTNTAPGGRVTREAAALPLRGVPRCKVREGGDDHNGGKTATDGRKPAKTSNMTGPALQVKRGRGRPKISL